MVHVFKDVKLIFDREKFLGIHRLQKLGNQCENLLYLIDMSSKVYRMNYCGNFDNNE